MLSPFSQPEHRPFTVGGGRRAALLIHGFPGTPAELRALGGRLADWGWRAHAPLLPGFGPDIGTLRSRRWREWRASIVRAWNDLGAAAEESVLIGYSMGGALALTAAAELAPSRLVLLAPFGGSTDWRSHLLPIAKHLVRDYRPCRDADFSDPQTRAAIRRFFPDADLDDPAVQRQVREGVVLPVASLDQLIRAGRAAWRAAPEVATRTLVIQGSDDDTVSASRTRALALRLGGRVELHELDAGHRLVQGGVTLEQVASRLQPFLDA